VLVLDEPTNDLDMETLDLLEQLLCDYPGTVLLVSHDRAFLDAVVTQVIVTEGDGHWREHVGGWSDWAQWKANWKAQPTSAAEPPRRQAGGTAESLRANRTNLPPSNDLAASKPKNDVSMQQMQNLPPAPGKPGRGRLNMQEEREIAALPDTIATLEAEQMALSSQLSDPSLHIEGAAKANAISQRINAIEQDLLKMLERWETLESRRTREFR